MINSCNPAPNLYTKTVQVHPLTREVFFIFDTVKVILTKGESFITIAFLDKIIIKEKVIRIQPPITLLFLYFYFVIFTSDSIYKYSLIASKSCDFCVFRSLITLLFCDFKTWEVKQKQLLLKAQHSIDLLLLDSM